MKKIRIAVILMMIACLALTVLTGCTGNTENEMNDDSVVSPANVDESVDGTEPAVEEQEEPVENDPVDDEPVEVPDEPVDEIPIEGPIDEETTALANEILNALSEDIALARDILAGRKLESAWVQNGVDQYGNLLFIDVVGPDGMEYTETFIPFEAPYDTIDYNMEIMHRVYTDRKCEEILSKYFVDNRYVIEVDGRLYHADADRPYSPCNMPIPKAIKIDDGENFEIVAKTTVTWDDGDYPYEIYLQKENGEWKIDKMQEYSDVTGWRDLDY